MRTIMLGALLAALFPAFVSARSVEDDAPALQIVVMDPLSAPLSCPCVQGYAQRQYDKLAQHLTRQLERPVEVRWAESLSLALDQFEKAELPRRADLVIGKDSVVRHDAKKLKWKLSALAWLSGKDGLTTQTGLIAVRAADPASSIEDLKGYRMIFGSVEAEEKHGAAVALLARHGVSAPAEREAAPSCSAGATRLLELPADERAAVVISSYARPLLEGCGQVPRGALRVVGETETVPFITAFVAEDEAPEDRAALLQALAAMRLDPFLMLAMETKKGFVPVPSKKDAPSEKSASPGKGAPSDEAGGRDR